MENLDRYYRRFVGCTRNSQTIVPFRGRNTRDRCSVCISTNRFGGIRARDKVPTVDVVDPAIVVIIDPVISYFTGVFPNIQIGMARLNTVIDDGDHNGTRSALIDIPR